MKEPAIEFLILNEIKLVDGKAVLDGRCLHEPIRAGQRINALVRFTPYTTPEGAADATTDFVCGVDLEVISVWAYGGYVSELSSMMSGRLEVGGGGIDKVRMGLALAFVETEK